LAGVAYLTHLYAPGLEGYGAAFSTELELVQDHSGIKDALIKGHGA